MDVEKCFPKVSKEVKQEGAEWMGESAAAEVADEIMHERVSCEISKRGLE